MLAPDGTNRRRRRAPHRQRHGQGDRPGVPLARDAGDRHCRDDAGNRGAEKINESYVSRVLRLTLLAPDIVEAILDGRQPAEVTLPSLNKPFPAEWDRQIVAVELNVRDGRLSQPGKSSLRPSLSLMGFRPPRCLTDELSEIS